MAKKHEPNISKPNTFSTAEHKANMLFLKFSCALGLMAYCTLSIKVAIFWLRASITTCMTRGGEGAGR